MPKKSINQPPQKRLYSKREVEKFFGIRANQLSSLVNDNILACVRVGRRVFFDRLALERFIQKGGKGLAGGCRRRVGK